MKQLIILCLAMMAATCQHEQIAFLTDKEVVILGNTVQEKTINNRGTTRFLEEGSVISFFSTGGIECNGENLTYTNNQWKGSKPFFWTNKHLQASVCAFYPPLPKATGELYTTNGELTDLLIAQNSYSLGETIRLSFEHLFTRLQFNVDKALNQQLKGFTIKTYQRITKINPLNAQIDTENVIEGIKTTYAPNNAGVYHIILPPKGNQTVDLWLQTKDGRWLQHTIKSLNCNRNNLYTYNVKENENTIGIETAADYIAFSKLINGMSCPNRSLKEFGKVINGDTTYILKNDIYFTSAEQNEIEQIGKKGFHNVFDGKGHTLYNVNLKNCNTTNMGIFYQIENNGVVKNLNICNSQIYSEKESGEMGVLCGRNNGKIFNCNIKNCEIATSKKHIGGLASSNHGTIANCSIDGLTLSINSNIKETNAMIFGAVSYYNLGEILNCCISQINNIKGKKKPSASSCICSVNYQVLSCCLVVQAPKDFYPFCRECRKYCEYCFYPSNLEYMAEKTDNMTKDEQKKHFVGPFHDTAESHNQAVMLLNLWIDKIGKINYPNIIFKRWKVYPDNSMGFENR